MDFISILNQLTANQQCLILNTMIQMEHCTPIKEISIANGIRHGRIIKDLFEKDMLKQLIPIYFQKKGYTSIDAENDLELIESVYKSMIDRNSRKSELYPIILKFLDIDEDLIATAYFSNLKPTELFASLSSRNQSAILYLMKHLETDFSFETIHSSGVE